jgi:hypothetical protein
VVAIIKMPALVISRMKNERTARRMTPAPRISWSETNDLRKTSRSLGDFDANCPTPNLENPKSKAVLIMYANSAIVPVIANPSTPTA